MTNEETIELMGYFSRRSPRERELTNMYIKELVEEKLNNHITKLEEQTQSKSFHPAGENCSG